MSAQAERGGEEKGQQEALTPVGSQDQWPGEILSDTPVLCQQSGGKPGVTFTSAKGEVFSVLEWAPGEEGRGHSSVRLSVSVEPAFTYLGSTLFSQTLTRSRRWSSSRRRPRSSSAQ